MTQLEVLQLDEVSKQFEQQMQPTIDRVSLSLKQGDILGLLGPSGCGKTTLLRLIAGFDRPLAGKISLLGKPVASSRVFVPPEQRDVGIVFQDYALFPHLKVIDNIAFGLKHRQFQKKGNVQQRLLEAISLVQLEGLQNRYPHQLSGGQQQRVALARALAPEPTLILLDEPLSNLDIQVRVQLRADIRRILKYSGSSAIFVTHDREEAFSICDWVGVLHDGNLEQLGTPEMLYRTPQSRFVAEFVTQANFIPARWKSGEWDTEIGSFPIDPSQSRDWADIMIREEDLQLKPQEEGIATVDDRQFLGREYRYILQTASGQELRSRMTTTHPIPIGAKVAIDVAPNSWQVFPAKS